MLLTAEGDEVTEFLAPMIKGFFSWASRTRDVQWVYALDDLTRGVSWVRGDQDSQSLGLDIFLFDVRRKKVQNVRKLQSRCHLSVK